MTLIAVLSIALAAALLALAAVALECRHRRHYGDAAAASARRGVELGQRLVEQCDQARQRALRAIEIADERRAEAADLRAELERRAAESYRGFRVVVQTKDGHTIDGIMAEVYEDHYGFTSAKILVGGDSRVLAGDELVPIDNVSWMQRPGGPRVSSESA